VSKAGEYRDTSSLQAETFWDAMRAKAMTPDRETFQQPGASGGFFGLGAKVAAQIGSIPAGIVDLVKSVPQLGTMLGGAMNPQGVESRMALGGMATDMMKNAVENPVSTAAGFMSPGGAYGLAREGVYATLGAKAPHAMMWLRSMLPWYEGKPWTRVPSGVADVLQNEFSMRPRFHGEDNAINVANKLQPYLESIGEPPLVKPDYNDAMNKYYAAEDAWFKKIDAGLSAEQRGPAPVQPTALRLPYTVPNGLEEVVGGAFIDQTTPGKLRLLDDLRWYLDTGADAVGARKGSTTQLGTSAMEPVTKPQLKELIGIWKKDPKEAIQLAKDLLGKGTMTGAPAAGPSGFVEPKSYYSNPDVGEVYRSNIRDLLEVLAKRHGHAYPIDWTVDVPVHPAAAAHGEFEAAKSSAFEYLNKNYPTGKARTPLENWWDERHPYAAIGRAQETIKNARKVIEAAGSKIAKRP
jgi:hypothetical protein